MAKQKSRTARWSDAASDCRDALEALDAAYSDLEAAISELKEVQGEYEEWQGNLPDSLQDGPVAEKLSAIVDDLELPDDPRESTYSELDEAISNAENADLPLGFGRD